MREDWRKAAIDGDVDLMERLVADGMAIDSRDRHGQTALMLAATHGRLPVVGLLLAHGADPDVTAKYGLSALMLAIINRHEAVATTLLDGGADPALRGTGAPGFHGKTASDLARAAGYDALADAVNAALAARALTAIETAFAGRTPPAEMTDSKQLSDVEYAEVMAFTRMRWQEIGFDMVEQNADAVFWFAPEAFACYLPGFLAAGLRENRTDSNAYDALIGMLDRSPEPAWWDDFFRPRWTLLNTAELSAVIAWVDWLQAVLPDAFHANSYDRARDTLTLLVAQHDDA